MEKESLLEDQTSMIEMLEKKESPERGSEVVDSTEQKIEDMKMEVSKLMEQGDFGEAGKILQEIQKFSAIPEGNKFGKTKQMRQAEEESRNKAEQNHQETVLKKIQKAYGADEAGDGETPANFETHENKKVSQEIQELSGKEFYNDEQVHEYLDPAKPFSHENSQIQEAVKTGNLSYASYLVKEFENKKAAWKAKIFAMTGLTGSLIGGGAGMALTAAGSSAAIAFGAASLLGGGAVALAGGGYYLYKRFKNSDADKKRTGLK